MAAKKSKSKRSKKTASRRNAKAPVASGSKRPRRSQEEIESILALLNEMTIKEAAAKAGVSVSAISSWKKKSGLVGRPGLRKAKRGSIAGIGVLSLSDSESKEMTKMAIRFALEHALKNLDSILG